ncbi:MAG: 30S ribosomal protein S4 [Deltaproteobacteria bacterium]|nr:30S ribosomal protein S4 [Deltaproteobacteria bacterium]
MARYSEAVCRFCRREGIKLFLKGDRCLTEKCAIERRQYGPGQHGQGRRQKQTEYGMQLREKQKVKRMYGLTEQQFRITFERAERMKGITGENLLQLLERRLDNTAYRCGIGRSRKEVRQLVMHGHVRVNGHRVSIPSYTVRQGDEITVDPKSEKLACIAESVEGVERRGGIPDWLHFEKMALRAQVTALPERQHLTMPMNEQLIVELYSK